MLRLNRPLAKTIAAKNIVAELRPELADPAKLSARDLATRNDLTAQVLKHLDAYDQRG